MPKPRTQVRTRRHQPADDALVSAADAFSIKNFCARHGISESFFHKLRAKGLGPTMMRVGARTLISVEAAAAWRRAREGADSTDASTTTA